MYGGAVFGGKSDFLLGDFAQDVPQEWGPHWHGILFRKSYPELEDLIARSKEIYPPWFGLSIDRHWSVGNKQWTWPNGATLRMRFLEREDDWEQYWGHSYTWIGWDELALYASLTPYLRLKARLRSAQLVPNKRIRASANPGGAGHNAVKRYFGIDQYPAGGVVIEPDDDSGMRRMFIRSRVADNQIGLRNDPKYISRLNGVGSPELVKALKDGDWNVVAGAFFPEFDIDKHVIGPFHIPQHWVRLRAMDWGSAAPFCVGWYAVSDGTVQVPWNGWPGDLIGYPLTIPRGALVKYREWYGAKEDGKGLKLTADEVAIGILEREATRESLELYQRTGDIDHLTPAEKINYSVLDPSAFSVSGGESIAHCMAKRKVFFQRADNKRVGKGALSGWNLVRSRLKGTETAIPMIYFVGLACPDTIRTLPALQHDKNRIEDADTTGDDHAPDETRYACSSRPWVREESKKTAARFQTQQTTNELIAARRRKRREASE